MTAAERAAVRIDKAIKVFADAYFEAGEWDRNESDEPYDRVHARCERAERRLRLAITGRGR